MAIAATAAGATVGFLFGIPRTHGRTAKLGDNNLNDDSSSVTNLEEIADWLSKILLGAGLTQISMVPEALENMALRVSGADNLTSNVVPITISVWVYFVIVGFFLGYLVTRLFVAGALKRAHDLGGGTLVTAGEKHPLEEILSQMGKSISDLQDHVKQVTQDQEAQSPAIITEKAQSSSEVPKMSVLWIGDPLTEPLQDELNTGNVSIKRAGIDSDVTELSKSFDMVVIVVPIGENQPELDESFLELAKQISSTVDKSKIVVFCAQEEAKARLDAHVTTLGISGITSSESDLLARLSAAH